jgi:hypothetical protein
MSGENKGRNQRLGQKYVTGFFFKETHQIYKTATLKQFLDQFCKKPVAS